VTSAARRRHRLKAIAADTIDICQRGHYQTADGTTVDIAPAIAVAVTGTRMISPEEALRIDTPVIPKPVIDVTGETTLAATHRLGRDGAVTALVFASARNPGGGFLTGAQAQEESIARSSGLYPCLQQTPDFYTHHRESRDLRYSDRIIYSPDVPVFRDDSGRLLDHPYEVTLLTAAAPNLGAILANQPEHADSVPQVLRRRAIRLLRVAAAHGRNRLVLGAWGCGVFRNDPPAVADAFTHALAHVPYFDHVTFAVYDTATACRCTRHSRRHSPTFERRRSALSAQLGGRWTARRRADEPASTGVDPLPRQERASGWHGWHAGTPILWA
jgi:uncharacterized protein (TIGR02452 family)